MQELSSAAMDVDAAGRGGRRALHYAVLAGALELVQLLVEQCRADILAEDSEGLTALDLALSKVNAGEGGLEDSADHIVEYLRRTHDLLPDF